MLALPKKDEELRAREYPWVSVSLKMMMTVMTPPKTPIMRGGVDACRKLVMWYEEARGATTGKVPGASWSTPDHLWGPTKKVAGLARKDQIS